MVTEVPVEISQLLSQFLPDRVTTVERIYLAFLNMERFKSLSSEDCLKFATRRAQEISGMPVFHCKSCLKIRLKDALTKAYHSSKDIEHLSIVLSELLLDSESHYEHQQLS